MKDLRSELDARKEQHLYRRRRIAESAQGPEMRIDGRTILAFCSNDYLGLANHPEVNQAFRKGVARWGSGSGAAHLVNGHSMAHHALEEELAEFTGRKRALLFSTGYMANLGIASTLLEKGDAVFEDRLNHASLLDAGLLSGARFQRYAHADSADLQQKLEKSGADSSLVMTDGLFSMDGDIAPLPQLAAACKQHGAWLCVDDAHGLGVLGNNGGGTLSHHNMSADEVPVLMGTLGKAFGTFGAFVAGSEELIETLIQKARTYIYTTALPSALAEATRISLKLVQREAWRREYLQQLISRFRHGAEQLGLPLLPSESAIQPLVIGDNARALALSEALWERGILITAIRPPTVPENSARLRITFSAAHTEKHLQQLLLALEELRPRKSGA
ncbi:MAG TPA: 8-amino-7-oxononanoate synthase [Gammaproteobacteria bacterium]|nr:8-amino-7-oxononanoate synthase [Gammaproteobacteria bacterium]